MENEEKFQDEKYAIDSLFQQTLKFKESSEFLHFITFIGKIFHYSHYNGMLVYLQNKDVKYFATPGYWKKTFDRTVNEGARPYVIIVPFGPASFVYDVRETSGKLSPEEFIERGIKGELFETGGFFPEELYSAIIKSLAEYNIIVRDKGMPINLAGFTDDYSCGKMNIRISEDLPPAQAFATLIHELAHNFLGHMGDKVLMKKSVYTQGPHKGESKEEIITIKHRKVGHALSEIEAETVSYLICSRWNLEHKAARYLSQHLSPSIISTISIETIITTADKIENYFLKQFRM